MDRDFFTNKIGESLREYRISRGLSGYRVAKDGGIPESRIRDIEDALVNYRIGSLLGYLKGCGLYLNITDKDGNYITSTIDTVHPDV